MGREKFAQTIEGATSQKLHGDYLVAHYLSNGAGPVVLPLRIMVWTSDG